MKFKTGFMIFLYATPWILMVSGVVSSFGLIMLMWGIMAFGMTGLGLAVTHDANHNAYSKNRKVNRFLGALLNCIGGYHVNWKVQHNVLHHSYTNIKGLDEDIATPAVRTTQDQDRKFFHRFQAIYAPFLYSLMSIYWLIRRDFILVNRYAEKGLLKKQGISKSVALRNIILNKAGYFLLIILLPILVTEIPWWQVLIGFASMQLLAGLMLALIFQTAHVVEHTHFYHSEEEGYIENSWAIHQMKTTSNYACNSTFFSWFIGGLNFQIEHHLFPNICHIHYKRISRIVKETASEFKVPYHEYPTFLGALKSHFHFLNRLGRVG